MKPRVSVPILLAGLPCLLGLWGCSAVLALSQYSESTSPHLIDDRATRAAVETKLGTPITTRVFDDGSSISTYQEEVYPRPSRFFNEPPWYRAAMYVSYDVFTFGLLEAFMTPLEAAGKITRAANRTTYEVTVTYDPDGCVVGVWREPQADP